MGISSLLDPLKYLPLFCSQRSRLPPETCPLHAKQYTQPFSIHHIIPGFTPTGIL